MFLDYGNLRVWEPTVPICPPFLYGNLRFLGPPAVAKVDPPREAGGSDPYALPFFMGVLHVRRCTSLGGGDGRGRGLHEVVLHVALEVEVREAVLTLELEERRELGVRVDLATVLLVLQLVVADVVVDLLAHVGSRHLRARRLAEESRQLVADQGRAHKARRLAVARATVLAVGHLLGRLVGLQDRLPQGLELGLEAREERVALVDLVAERRQQLNEVLAGHLVARRGRGDVARRLLRLLLGSRGSGGNNGGGDLFSLGLRGSLLGHPIILYTGSYLLSDLTRIIYIVTVVW